MQSFFKIVQSAHQTSRLCGVNTPAIPKKPTLVRYILDEKNNTLLATFNGIKVNNNITYAVV